MYCRVTSAMGRFTMSSFCSRIRCNSRSNGPSKADKCKGRSLNLVSKPLGGSKNRDAAADACWDSSVGSEMGRSDMGEL